jgi:hypothetical protein
LGLFPATTSTSTNIQGTEKLSQVTECFLDLNYLFHRCLLNFGWQTRVTNGLCCVPAAALLLTDKEKEAE